MAASKTLKNFGWICIFLRNRQNSPWRASLVLGNTGEFYIMDEWARENWHIWNGGIWGKTAAVDGTLQSRDSSLWLQSLLLVQVWLCLQQLVLWLVAELYWEPTGACSPAVGWAGSQLGGVGGYLLGAAVEPAITLALIYLRVAAAGSAALSPSICLLHVFVPLHKKGTLASITPLGQK